MPAKPDKEDLSGRLYTQLKRLRRSGASTPKVAELPDLLVVAEALVPEGDPEQRITAVLELAIEDFEDKIFSGGALKRDIAREWFGLDPKTRQLDHNERHQYVAERISVLSGSFQTHEASDILDFLADQLVSRYERQSGDTEVVPETAKRNHRRLRLIVAGLVVLAVGGVGMKFLLAPGGMSPKVPTIPQNELMEPASFPPLVRGRGAQKMHAGGHYGRIPFTAQTGLIIAQPYGEVEIKLFPGPTSCALWYEGTPVGLEFDIGVNATAATISNVPIGHPLRNYNLSWAIEHGNSTMSDFVNATSFNDGIAGPGSVTLTKLDTGYGGLWHGRVTTGDSQTATGKRQYFAGTFAAEWCNLEPFRSSY